MIRTAELAVRYAQLRDGERWLDSATLTGLEIEPDGSIVLQRVPAVAHLATSGRLVLSVNFL